MAKGKVHEFSYIPGDLWTVSPLGVHHVTNLFARNERLTTYIQTEKGECALVKVGATVVGRIRISYDNQISNLHGALAKHVFLKKPYELRRGEEVGMFELGSTVICLFPPGQVELNEMELGQKIKMGNNIGRFKLK
jgi:phosphatidylserine decarboxylase